ncbi:hypothetical protein [Convivina praedatoris]|uniref:Uncharacterized protein n=1 Tax=Convivina praedatoris TaxID=2880963 RepID=A0ABN8HEB7_9LACO|nr:hypothetical protein [Convivina sp. LMG 32447]CAH1856003.1 hypothetical protein R078138_01238 [Convivina sp. LMG 32447]CAH1856194.1 hypothetical protein R077815_01348 [Convivina sp. LMG 32447]CAH1857156.1 hypothetical protein LMG032447_01461 [Convivina sp. LMG 32447]
MKNKIIFENAETNEHLTILDVQKIDISFSDTQVKDSFSGIDLDQAFVNLYDRHWSSVKINDNKTLSSRYWIAESYEESN